MRVSFNANNPAARPTGHELCFSSSPSPPQLFGCEVPPSVCKHRERERHSVGVHGKRGCWEAFLLTRRSVNPSKKRHAQCRAEMHQRSPHNNTDILPFRQRFQSLGSPGHDWQHARSFSLMRLIPCALAPCLFGKQRVTGDAHEQERERGVTDARGGRWRFIQEVY